MSRAADCWRFPGFQGDALDMFFYEMDSVRKEAALASGSHATSSSDEPLTLVRLISTPRKTMFM